MKREIINTRGPGRAAARLRKFLIALGITLIVIVVAVVFLLHR